LNGLSGKFIRAAVGQNGFNLDAFIATEGLPFVDIVHADIQQSELIMLRDMERTLLTKKVGYLFISTHSQLLHEQCRRYLEDCDYVTIASADFDHESFCHDGILVARNSDLNGPIHFDIGSRTKQFGIAPL